MALNAPINSFNKTLVLAFGMMFGLVALAAGYSVLSNKSSMDIRSKAAEETTIYKQWEFTGGSTENWVTNAPYSLDVVKGRLALSVVKSESVAVIKNAKAATEMPGGNKYLVMSLSVGQTVRQTGPVPSSCPPPPTCAGQQLYTDTDHPIRGVCPSYKCIPISTPGASNGSGGFGAMVRGAEDEAVDEDRVARDFQSTGKDCAADVRKCPDGSVVARQGSACGFASCPDSSAKYTGKIYYSLKKNEKSPAEMQKPLEFSGVANGSPAEIKVKFPEIGKADLRTVRIQFTSGVKPGDTVAIDWIRLIGARIAGATATPTPTPVPVVTCVPRPSCMDPVDGGPVCMVKIPEGSVFCPKNTTTPTPTYAMGTPPPVVSSTAKPDTTVTVTGQLTSRPYSINGKTDSMFYLTQQDGKVYEIKTYDADHAILKGYVGKKVSITGKKFWSTNRSYAGVVYTDSVTPVQ